jgi:hypothetical protein
MRINTDGNKSYRDDLYEDTAEAFGEGTKSGGIDAACRYALEMIGDPGRVGDPGALQEVVNLLEDPRIPDDVAVEIASALSAEGIDVTYRPAAAGYVTPSQD